MKPLAKVVAAIIQDLYGMINFKAYPRYIDDSFFDQRPLFSQSWGDEFCGIREPFLDVVNNLREYTNILHSGMIEDVGEVDPADVMNIFSSS